MSSLHHINQGFLPKNEIDLINHLLDSGLMISELVSTDSRSIKPGQFFVALKGLNFDGHEHIKSAFDLSASCVVSSKSFEELALDVGLRDRVIQVDDTLKFLHRLANAYRSSVNPLVIAVTGSAGKTTAKELIKLGLEKFFRLHATSANFNNEIGVPLTIFNMPRDTQVLVLEMGMRGLGQIHDLSKIATPNICIITNIGTAHIELLGSQENIKKAKMEIVDFFADYQGSAVDLKIPKTLIVDKNLFEDLKASGFKNPNSGAPVAGEILFFDYSNPLPESSLGSILFSDGLKADMNAVMVLADILKLDKSQVLQALMSYNPGKGRGQFSYDKNANLFIDESYNSNTVALKNSALALLEQFPTDEKIIVAGDIKESDPALIDEVFREINTLAEDSSCGLRFLDVRNLSQEKIYNLVKSALDEGSGRKVILFKASRAVALDKVIEKFFI
jgi:UDP-N-acetylmuramoyl-tripeptide--D-alanyl-D-alanine ligase